MESIKTENSLIERLKVNAPELWKKIDRKQIKHQFSITMTDEELHKLTEIKNKMEERAGLKLSRSKIIKMLLWSNAEFAGGGVGK